MAGAWEHIGDIADIAQLHGLDACRLIGMIVKAASTARMHKKNCRQFAQHLKLVGNLLEQLRISELKKYPETREPLEQLEDALRRSFILVNSCQDRSYPYLLAMGWNIVQQFRRAQNEIDQYLKIVPLIILVDNARVRHISRINGGIPSVDEATLDRQRLLDRLQFYGLIEINIQGDGNCQFHALSDQFYRTPDHHKIVRQQVVNQLKSCPHVYEGYVPMAYGDYLKKMSKNGEWGDPVTLQAAADAYGVKIFVITSFKDTCYIEILPSVQRSERVIFLSFWAEVHYNSIYPEGGVPELETKKKRWWDFGDKHSELEDDYN